MGGNVEAYYEAKHEKEALERAERDKTSSEKKNVLIETTQKAEFSLEQIEDLLLKKLGNWARYGVVFNWLEEENGTLTGVEVVRVTSYEV